MQQFNIHSYSSFVRPAVKLVPTTQKILDGIMPYFPASCKCIAGYLDAKDQFWKVNYHWDNLVWHIDIFLKNGKISYALRECAKGIKNVLMSNAPNPITGYRKDSQVGKTKDISSPEKIIARHSILKHCKKEFERILINSKTVCEKSKRNPANDEKHWWLAVAPVALPGNSKHGTGYALDLSGDNREISFICKGLGATLVFNEASHVHVEFAKGVHLIV